MKISIIIATFNSEDFIENCIKSIINQTSNNYEIIIIDGSSTDNTNRIITKYKEYIKFYVSEPDKGIYDAWNKGLDNSNSDWIMFVGSDDILKKDAIENYIDFITKNSNQHIEYVSARMNLTDKKGNIIRTVGEKWRFSKFRRFMNVAHPASIHHISLFEKYGVYDTTYKIAGDYELLLRAKSKLKAEFIDTVVIDMGMEGVSSVLLHKVFKESFRAKNKTANVSKILCFVDYCHAYFANKIHK